MLTDRLANSFKGRPTGPMQHRSRTNEHAVKPANEADSTDIGQDLVEQDEWANGWICEGVFRRRTQTKRSVPSATVVSARDGMVISRLVREPA
jgi:hypothetical protein